MNYVIRDLKKVTNNLDNQNYLSAELYKRRQLLSWRT